MVEKKDFDFGLLLGVNVIKAFRLRQDERLTISQAQINKKSEGNRAVAEHKKDELIKLEVISEKPTKKIMINWNEYMPIEEFHAQTEHLDKEQKDTIHSLIDKYETLFARNRYDVGTFSEQQAHIKLSKNKFIARKPYKCSIEDQEEIQKQVAELLKAGLIEESCSPFAAPVTLAYRKAEKKKNRMCIDFCELNKLIIPETFPFPTIEDIILKT